jgi:hypothetical protein
VAGRRQTGPNIQIATEPIAAGVFAAWRATATEIVPIRAVDPLRGGKSTIVLGERVVCTVAAQSHRESLADLGHVATGLPVIGGAVLAAIRRAQMEALDSIDSEALTDAELEFDPFGYSLTGYSLTVGDMPLRARGDTTSRHHGEPCVHARRGRL